MSAKTSIEWTDRTWNPTRGCTRVSEGCRNCYAERFAARMSTQWGRGFARWTPSTAKTAAGAIVRVKSEPRWTGKVALVPEALDQPLRWRKPQRVFVNSMSDLFHESLANEDIVQVFHAMYGEASASPSPKHTYQILTKRPARMLDWFRWLAAYGEQGGDDPTILALSVYARFQGPHPRVWLGVSVEDQATADERIPLLLQTPAAVRFVSYEPALGPVDFRCLAPFDDFHTDALDTPDPTRRLNWLIVGGESGPDARDFYLAWARSAIAQCKPAGISVFIKQVGARPIERCPECYGSGASIPANTSGTCPECCGDGVVMLRLRDRKGGDPAEWPEDLRVREFPA
jgi:protein gp37